MSFGASFVQSSIHFHQLSPTAAACAHSTWFSFVHRPLGSRAFAANNQWTIEFNWVLMCPCLSKWINEEFFLIKILLDDCAGAWPTFVCVWQTNKSNAREEERGRRLLFYRSNVSRVLTQAPRPGPTRPRAPRIHILTRLVTWIKILSVALSADDQTSGRPFPRPPVVPSHRTTQ